jgi:hypothetical protein
LKEQVRGFIVELQRWGLFSGPRLGTRSFWIRKWHAQSSVSGQFLFQLYVEWIEGRGTRTDHSELEKALIHVTWSHQTCLIWGKFLPQLDLGFLWLKYHEEGFNYPSVPFQI